MREEEEKQRYKSVFAEDRISMGAEAQVKYRYRMLYAENHISMEEMMWLINAYDAAEETKRRRALGFWGRLMEDFVMEAGGTYR